MQFFSLSMSTNGQIKYEVVESYIVKAAVHYIDHIYFEKSLTRYCKITFGVKLVAVDFSTFKFIQVNKPIPMNSYSINTKQNRRKAHANQQ